MAKTPQLDANGHRKFGIRDKLAYAAGDLGCNMSFALKGTMALFWTQVMGMGLWYSLLLVIVQVWDAINDPLVGYWAVNHRFKNGEKCRPLALWCAVPWAITVVLMFTCFDVSYGLKFGRKVATDTLGRRVRVVKFGMLRL